MPDSMSEMIAAVRAHAQDNYESEGWDYVVECWSDLDITRAIEDAGAQDKTEAIDVVRCEVSVRDEMRRDVQGWADEPDYYGS